MRFPIKKIIALVVCLCQMGFGINPVHAFPTKFNLAASTTTDKERLFTKTLETIHWQNLPDENEFTREDLIEFIIQMFLKEKYMTEQELSEVMEFSGFIDFVKERKREQEEWGDDAPRFVREVEYRHGMRHPSRYATPFLPEEERDDWFLLDDVGEGIFPRFLYLIHNNLLREYLEDQEFPFLLFLYNQWRIRMKYFEEKKELEEKLLIYFNETSLTGINASNNLITLFYHFIFFIKKFPSRSEEAIQILINLIPQLKKMFSHLEEPTISREDRDTILFFLDLTFEILSGQTSQSQRRKVFQKLYRIRAFMEAALQDERSIDSLENIRKGIFELGLIALIFPDAIADINEEFLPAFFGFAEGESSNAGIILANLNIFSEWLSFLDRYSTEGRFERRDPKNAIRKLNVILDYGKKEQPLDLQDEQLDLFNFQKMGLFDSVLHALLRNAQHLTKKERAALQEVFINIRDFASSDEVLSKRTIILGIYNNDPFNNAILILTSDSSLEAYLDHYPFVFQFKVPQELLFQKSA